MRTVIFVGLIYIGDSLSVWAGATHSRNVDLFFAAIAILAIIMDVYEFLASMLDEREDD